MAVNNFKVVLLGEGESGRGTAQLYHLFPQGCVGKTSTVLRYVENKFEAKHLSTLQVRIRSNDAINICRGF